MRLLEQLKIFGGSEYSTTGEPTRWLPLWFWSF